MKETINENILDFLDKRKREMIAVMNKMGILDGTYTFKNDYTVDLSGSIYIRDKESKVSPIKFSTCQGNFTWSHSNLESMDNFPNMINGDFNVAYNHLNNLKKGPQVVQKSYNCSNNHLQDLTGAPYQFTGAFTATSCGLESLKGSPTNIQGDFNVSNNNLTTLEHGPLYVVGTMILNDNKLKNLEHLPFCKKVSYDNNPLEKINTGNEQLHLPFEDHYIVGDKVKYYRDGSPYNEMIGEITIVKEKDGKIVYGVKFADVVDKDKRFNKEVTVINVDPKRLIKKDSTEKKSSNNEIEVGDRVLVKYPKGIPNPDGKVFLGEIESLDEYGIALVKYKENNKWYSHISQMSLKSKAEETILPVETPVDYIVGDKIIYVDPKNKPQFELYDGCEGEIETKELNKVSGKYIYGVKIIDKEGKTRHLINIYNERLKPKGERSGVSNGEITKFNINDRIIYTNPEFPSNTGCRGSIVKVLDNDMYDIRLVNKDNVTKNMTNVPHFRLTPIPKEISNVSFKKGEKVILRNTRQEAFITNVRSFYLNDIETTKYDIEVPYPSGGSMSRYSLKADELEKIKKGDFKIGDKIIYLDPYGIYDECKGFIYATYGADDDEVGITLTTHGNVTISLPRAKKKHLESAENYKEEIPKEKSVSKYKKGDKIIYNGDKEDGKCKGLSGIVTSVSTNNYMTNNNNLDLLIFMPDGKEKALYYVSPSNVEPYVDEFEVGEKVKYNNPNDKELNNRKGIIKSVKTVDDKKVYKVTFNVNDELVNVTNVDELSLYKYIPLDDIYINDNVTYTKVDSKFFGCKGIVKNYSIDDDTYHLELTSKDNRKVNIKKTKLENIEKVSEKDYFKIGDKVKYIATHTKNIHSGSIGHIVKKFSEYYYDVEITTSTGAKVTVSAPRECLSLVNEKEEGSRFKFNDHVLYKKEDSKYNNRIGEYQRVREDGKYEIKFWNSLSDFNRVYVDNEFLEPYDGDIPEKKTTTYTTVKRKKKEKPPPLKPVLVYNRRPVAVKMGKKKTEEPKIEEKKPIVGLDEVEYDEGQ
jgi:hypothetical protein